MSFDVIFLFGNRDRMGRLQKEAPREIKMDCEPPLRPSVGKVLFECLSAAIPTEEGKRLWPQRPIRCSPQISFFSLILSTHRSGQPNCGRSTSRI
jgi:hypothetical protein